MRSARAAPGMTIAAAPGREAEKAAGLFPQLDLCLGVADELIPALLGDSVDHDTVAVDRLDRAADGDLLLGHSHAAELHAEALQGAGVAVCQPGVGAGDEAHHVEA